MEKHISGIRKQLDGEYNEKTYRLYTALIRTYLLTQEKFLKLLPEIKGAPETDALTEFNKRGLLVI